MATQKKIETVKELSEKITKAKAIVLADYRGLKHKQLETLHKSLKKTDAEIVVTKNRLLKLSLGDKVKKLEDYLQNTTATLFAYGDEVLPLKELQKFFKTAGMGSTKGGLLGDVALNAKDIDRLAQLPPKNTLLTQLVGQLNAPIQGLHYALSWNINKLVYALNAIKEKKGN